MSKNASSPQALYVHRRVLQLFGGAKIASFCVKTSIDASVPHASQSSPACFVTGRNCKFRPLRRRDSVAPARGQTGLECWSKLQPRKTPTSRSVVIF